MTKLSFSKKINIKEKVVHEQELWAEDVNEMMDLLEEMYTSILNFQNAQTIQTFADAWPIGGMDVRGYATNYPILDQYYNAISKTVTHAAAPTTAGWGRIDAVVADIQGEVLIIQGDAGAVFTEPTVDPTTHYLIRYFLILANATSPVDPITETGPSVAIVAYRENLGAVGGEANVTGSNATINVNSVNSLIGAIGIEATNPQKMHKVEFNWPVMQSTVGITHLQCVLKMKATVDPLKYWFIGLLKDGKRISNSWFLFKNAQYGFNAFSLNEQTILIPIEATPFQNQDFNGMEIFFYHQNSTIPGYFMDNVEFLDGITSNPNVPAPVSHSHTNLSVLESITQTFVNNWNSAVSWIASVKASLIPFVPYLTLGSTNVQAAIEELKDEVDLKLDASAYNQYFKGVFLTEAALIAAYPTASVGDRAQVNVVGATQVINYAWDAEDSAWVITGSVSGGAANTDELPEGTTNFYFTTARVLATVLTGISFLTGTAVVATDTVLVAFGKLQKQINDLLNVNYGTSPNNFTGTDTVKIQAAADYASANNVPMIIPKKDAINTPWYIENAILLKSNTTITIDGAILKLTDTSRDNVFRTENCGFGIVSPFTVLENIHIIGLNGATLEGAANPRATGDNGKTLGIDTYGTDAGVGGQTQTGDWRNYFVLFAYTTNYSIAGINFLDSHSYCVTNERCSFGRFTALRCNLIKLRSYGTVLNTNLLDFRMGCNNMILEDINGFSDDDPVAIVLSTATEGAGLYGTYQVTGNIYGGVTDDIHTFLIKDVVLATNFHHIRIFNYATTKIYNITIKNVIDANPSNVGANMSVIKLGDVGYGGANDLGELYGISIDNVVNKSMPYCIDIGGSLSESNISNVIDLTSIVATYPIFQSAGNKGTRDVQLSNIFKKNYFNTISGLMSGFPSKIKGTRINITSGKVELFDEDRSFGGEIIGKEITSPTDVRLFWSGTAVQYAALTPDANTIYFIVG